MAERIYAGVTGAESKLLAAIRQVCNMRKRRMNVSVDVKEFSVARMSCLAMVLHPRSWGTGRGERPARSCIAGWLFTKMLNERALEHYGLYCIAEM